MTGMIRAIVAATAVLSLSGQVLAQGPSIVPKPANVTMAAGALTVKSGDSISYPVNDAAAKFDAEYLAALVKKTRGIALTTRSYKASPPPSGIVLVKSAETAANAEAYSLKVTAQRVEISAAKDGGLFYGAVSAWQLLTADEKANGPAKLQCMEIHDTPELKWRGIMLDSARHMQPISFIYQLVDWMAQEKLNVLHWHLTDDQGWRLEIKRYPKLTEVGGHRQLFSPTGELGGAARITAQQLHYGGFYSQVEVRALVKYAAARNITIVPEIEMPGHETAAIAAYPELASTSTPPTEPASEYGILPNLFNVDDKTFEFLQNVLTEVMDLFPGQYIHVGGDEAFKGQWQANAAIQEKMKALGVKDEDALQSYFIQRVDKFIAAYGRHTIGWDEILQGGLAPGAAVMSWHGVAGGVAAAKQGHDAVLLPTRPLYFNYRQSEGADEAPGRWALNTLENVYKFSPAPDTLTAQEREHILGVEGALWSEYVITPDRIEWMVFPRSAALAEIGWSAPASRDWTDFLQRMTVENHRFKVLGIHSDPAIYRVRATEAADYSAGNVTVSLANQGGFGVIRYTTEGAAVTASSKKYDAPFALPIGATTLHAAAFDPETGAEIDGSAMTRMMDAVTLRRRASQELQLCANDPVIGMEQDPPQGDRPVSLANYRNPCWIYKNADLDKIKTLKAGVMSLPWLFHDRGSVITPTLGVAHTPSGELEVHLDSCTGETIAALPFAPAVGRRGVVELNGDLLSQSGKHDLCFKVVRPAANPLWVVDWVGLEP